MVDFNPHGPLPPPLILAQQQQQQRQSRASASSVSASPFMVHIHPLCSHSMHNGPHAHILALVSVCARYRPDRRPSSPREGQEAVTILRLPMP
jgi:hypothetical protein